MCCMEMEDGLTVVLVIGEGVPGPALTSVLLRVGSLSNFSSLSSSKLPLNAIVSMLSRFPLSEVFVMVTVEVAGGRFLPKQGKHENPLPVFVAADIFRGPKK